MNDPLQTVLNLPPRASTAARDVDMLHYFIIIVTMAGALVVTALAVTYAIRYRKGAPGKRRSFAPFPIHVEVGIIVGLLGLFVTWWVIGFRQYVAMRVPPKETTEVYVIAKQWMWTFVDEEGRESNGVLYVPTNRPIKLLMSSRDVIHSFFVPEFRIKQDVVPGRMTTVWFEVTTPGRYQILCTEYCGTAHSTMRGEVVALSEADYARHMQAEEPSPSEPQVASLATIGKRVAADAGCLRCHTADGTPHIGPTWAGLYLSQIELESGDTVLVDEAFITESIMAPEAKVHAGFAPVMPSYQGLLGSADVAAIVHFIKSIRTPPKSTDRDPLPTRRDLEVQP